MSERTYGPHPREWAPPTPDELARIRQAHDALKWSTGGGYDLRSHEDTVGKLLAHIDAADATLARVRAMHTKRDNVTHGCCAPPRLCTGHPPVCESREHHWSDRPTWPCDTIRALDGVQ